MGIFGESPRRLAGKLAEDFLVALPLPVKAEGTPVGDLKQSLEYCLRNNQKLILVSSVCPPYASDSSGRPTYEDLGVGIEFNTEQHLLHIPKACGVLKGKVGFAHFFLMADTEVDLIPFLKKLDITPEEFVTRCQGSVELIGELIRKLYGSEVYQELGIPEAARFLEYFGVDEWYKRYEYFRSRLTQEIEQDSEGRVARGVARDVQDRQLLIYKLLGAVGTKQMGEHIVRQKAQYMAYASLLRERFGRRLVIVNHRTPNFKWMNDRIVREPNDPEKLKHGSYLPPIPLIELDISTMPEE